MSIMIAQSLENNRHAPSHTIGTPVPADNQVTQLLLQAMSLVGHDALTAIDFMRRASALAANEQPFAEPHDTIPTGTPGALRLGKPSGHGASSKTILRGGSPSMIWQN